MQDRQNLEAAHKSVAILFWVDLFLSLVLLAAGSIGLVMTPRPIFTWFPSLLAVAAAVFSLAGLLALDRGVKFRERDNTCVFVLAAFGVVLLTLLACASLIFGFVTGQTTIKVTIPLLVVCLLHTLFSILTIRKAVIFRSRMPTKSELLSAAEQKGHLNTTGTNGHVGQVVIRRPPPAYNQTSTLNSQGHRFSTVAMDQGSRPPSAMQRIGPPLNSSNGQAVHYSPDGTVYYNDNNFRGSVQTVYTMASDV